MTIKKINGISFNLDDFVEYYKPNTGERGGLPVFLVQPGFEILINNKLEFVYDVEYEDYSIKKNQLYFLHIPKTGGMSIKRELLQAFKDKTVFSNFIQYIDDYKILGSEFISGHFAMYPIELFKNNEKGLISYTIIRDPLYRFLSNFLYYKRKIIDLRTNVDKNINILLDEYIENNANHNTQYKHLTSTIDTNFINNQFSLLRNKEINMDQFYINISSLNYLEPLDYSFHDIVNNINIIDVLELRNSFESLEKILDKFNINYKIENIIRNMGTESTKDFVETLSHKTIKKIKDINEKDYELYEYIIDNKKAG